MSHTQTDVLLQRVLLNVPAATRPLYWRATRPQGAEPDAELLPDGSVRIGAGTTLHVDSYFGSFFEQHWYARTRLRSVMLRLQTEGRCRVRIRRRNSLADRIMEETFSTGGPIMLEAGHDVAHHRHGGVLGFEVTALGDGARLLHVAWLGRTPRRGLWGLRWCSARSTGRRISRGCCTRSAMTRRCCRNWRACTW